MAEFEPSRLIVARRRRGLTQNEIAEQLGLSKQLISFFESGQREPTDAHVQQLAFLLRFPVGFFSGHQLELTTKEIPSFRSLRSMTSRVRDTALSASDIATQIISPDLHYRFSFPKIDVPDLSAHANRPEEAADILRALWRLGAGPISNMVHLLESKGVEVYWLRDQSGMMDGLSLWRDHQPYVWLDVEKDAGDRARFSAAHELGHLVLHRDITVSDNRECEEQANFFASAFLMPADQFSIECPKRPELPLLFALKKRWGTSVQAQIMRGRDLGIFSDWQARYAFQEISAKGMRTNEKGKGLPDIPREESHLHRKIFESLAKKGLTPQKYASTLQIGLDELCELMPTAREYLAEKPEKIGPERPTSEQRRSNLRLVRGG
jgi:Zn-dependent peptidase ImmA (M78 family)/DNA-binding XRE family transcriptional regulator